MRVFLDFSAYSLVEYDLPEGVDQFSAYPGMNKFAPTRKLAGMTDLFDLKSGHWLLNWWPSVF